MKQTITGNRAFIKRTILPMTKQAGIKRVKVKDLPAHMPDEKDQMEITLDLDKEQNATFLDLLKKKAGKKGSMKRKKLNLSVMKEILRKIEVSLISVSNKEHRDLKISSSYIKKALMDGDVKKANLLLERNYILSGQVIEGKKYGSKLGYPTANIETKEEKIIPKDGIYKTSTTVDNKEYRSVTSIGDNPTFNETKKSIETFIVNFDKNIYGKAIKIAFEDFIRDQIKFDDIGDLKRQMSVDVEYIANSKE